MKPQKRIVCYKWHGTSLNECNEVVNAEKFLPFALYIAKKGTSFEKIEHFNRQRYTHIECICVAYIFNRSFIQVL